MRLIDADALIAYMCGHCGASCNLEDEYCANVDAVENAPTVDAVEVVRCYECKHFKACKEIEGVTWTGFCNYGQFHTDEYDFCSRGERRNDGQIL